MPRWAPLAAVVTVGVAGLAAAAVACRRKPAVAEESAPPEAPPPPVESPLPPANAEPGRFRGLLLAAIVAAVVGVWWIALLHNAMDDPVCGEAGEHWNQSGSRGTTLRVDAYRAADDYDSPLGAEVAAVRCVGRR